MSVTATGASTAGVPALGFAPLGVAALGVAPLGVAAVGAPASVSDGAVGFRVAAFLVRAGAAFAALIAAAVVAGAFVGLADFAGVAAFVGALSGVAAVTGASSGAVADAPLADPAFLAAPAFFAAFGGAAFGGAAFGGAAVVTGVLATAVVVAGGTFAVAAFLAAFLAAAGRLTGGDAVGESGGPAAVAGSTGSAVCGDGAFDTACFRAGGSLDAETVRAAMPAWSVRSGDRCVSRNVDERNWPFAGACGARSVHRGLDDPSNRSSGGLGTGAARNAAGGAARFVAAVAPLRTAGSTGLGSVPPVGWAGTTGGRNSAAPGEDGKRLRAVTSSGSRSRAGRDFCCSMPVEPNMARSSPPSAARGAGPGRHEPASDDHRSSLCPVA
jgi:hypothetical protein